MTEAEQIAKVCEWLGMDIDPCADLVGEDGATEFWLCWWSREGWWRVLEAWALKDRKRCFSLYFTEKRNEYRIVLTQFRPKVQCFGNTFHDTPSAATLAAFELAMRDEQS